jgi:ribosomal protein S1
VKDINNHFVKGQSVVAAITEIDTAQARFSVNLKNSVNFPVSTKTAPSRYESLLLESLFLERDIICRHILSKGESTTEIKETKLAIGQPISGSIKQILPYGSILQLDDLTQIVGLITNRQSEGKKFAVGDRVDAFVLDFDVERKIADLSVSPKVSQLNKKIMKKVFRIHLLTLVIHCHFREQGDGCQD